MAKAGVAAGSGPQHSISGTSFTPTLKYIIRDNVYPAAVSVRVQLLLPPLRIHGQDLIYPLIISFFLDIYYKKTTSR